MIKAYSKTLFTFLSLCIPILFITCTDKLGEIPCDPLTTVTYESDIKQIVDTKCAVSSCHVPGFMPGDYSTYAGLSTKFAEDLIRLKAVELRGTADGMPPPWAMTDQLTDEEAELVLCWALSGYPEN